MLDATTQPDRTVEPLTVATHHEPVVDPNRAATPLLTGISAWTQQLGVRGQFVVAVALVWRALCVGLTGWSGSCRAPGGL